VSISSTSSPMRMSLLSVAALSLALVAGAQTPATAPADTAAAPASAAQAPAPAPDPKPWRVGPMDVSGFLDGYYSYNSNDPSEDNNGKINDLYNFNDKTNQWALNGAKLTLNHDPAPIGARVDLVYGRINKLVNASNQLEFVEQAYFSVKPPKAKGFELDLGKFVTSAGAEVIESKDNWNYSRSILFAWAIPYYHFGLRSSMPVSKTETIGVQLVNGWNNIVNDVGGPTVGVTSSYVKPKYTWNADFYTGPANYTEQHGYRNLFDTTVLLTPNSKFNAYINYDIGANSDSIHNGIGDNKTNLWQGVAFAAHQQISSKFAGTGRIEVFNDRDGYSTGVAQTVKEFTATGEYHWPLGLIARAEYRHDWSDQPYFHKNADSMVDSQNTFTIGLIAIFAPKR
jgi:hypothetical protein